MQTYEVVIQLTTTLRQETVGPLVLQLLGNPAAKVMNVTEIALDEEDKKISEDTQTRVRNRHLLPGELMNSYLHGQEHGFISLGGEYKKSNKRKKVKP